MVKRTLFILLAFAGCASFQSRSVASLNLPWGLSANDLPEPLALISWRTPNYGPSRAPEPESLKHVEIPEYCGDRNLYPVNPQQGSKIYHIYRQADYDHRKLSPQSLMCKIRSKENLCLMADVFEYALISDTYEDGCGNLYRGLWNVAFRKRDESMGTLLSKGRTVFPKPGSEFENELEEGDTYALSRSDFLFLSAPFPGDQEKAGQLRQKSQATHKYDPATHLFLRKPPPKAFQAPITNLKS